MSNPVSLITNTNIKVKIYDLFPHFNYFPPCMLNGPNISVSWASVSQKGPALFQEPESFKKVQFQEIINFGLILELEVKL
jgi:hypothetical protein